MEIIPSLLGVIAIIGYLIYLITWILAYDTLKEMKFSMHVLAFIPFGFYIILFGFIIMIMTRNK